jgi:hypothetical protein
MLTAGHVVSSIDRSSGNAIIVGVQGPDTYFQAAYVTEAELIGADLGLLKVDFVIPGSDRWFNRFRWADSPLDAFTRVRAVGYAYGMHRVEDRQSIVTRGFEGHIVSTLNEFKPLGSAGGPFSVHELSFMAPRGLSGAPLLNASGKVTIHGVVIGNSETRMMVFRSEERVAEPTATATVEQYEALTLGIAVAAGDVLSRESRLLGTSVRDHLEAHNLLA